jgi:catalase-peroxidase
MLARVLATLEGCAATFSMADAIVLGGVVGLRRRSDAAAPWRPVHRRPRRRHGAADRRRQLAVMEPEADAFRNYVRKKKLAVKTEEMMLDRASLLGCRCPRWWCWSADCGVLGANHGERGHGHFTKAFGPADQRLLRQPARHDQRVDGGRRQRR